MYGDTLMSRPKPKILLEAVHKDTYKAHINICIPVPGRDRPTRIIPEAEVPKSAKNPGKLAAGGANPKPSLGLKMKELMRGVGD